MEIHNRDDQFDLYFDEQISYKVNCRNPATVWFQPNDWGLGYNLGFDKKALTSYENCEEKKELKQENLLWLANLYFKNDRLKAAQDIVTIIEDRFKLNKATNKFKLLLSSRINKKKILLLE